MSAEDGNTELDYKALWLMAKSRVSELELASSNAVAQLMYGTNGKSEALKILRSALGR